MSGYHTQKMQAAKARMMVHGLMIRGLYAVGIGGLVTILTTALFTPKGMVQNLVDYGTAYLVLKVRELPLLGFKEEHVFAFEKARIFMQVYVPYWTNLLYLFCVVTGVSLVLFWIFYLRKNRSASSDIYKRGSRLLSPGSHNFAMRLSYRKNPPNKMGTPLVLGKEKVLIPETLQYRHFAFMGAAGYGKSTAIEEILAHARKAKQKCLVVDLNGIFYSRFGAPGDHLLSLRDNRSDPWSFWTELASSGDVHPENMAAALIEAEGGGHQYFWKGARALLASLLRLNSSIDGLDQDLHSPVSNLRKKLQEAHEISARVLGDQDGDQADGIIGTTALDFAFLSELKALEPKPGTPGFSIAQWLKDDHDTSWVFLAVREQDLEQTRPLLRLWFDLACLGALQREPNDPDSPHVWLVIDELKSVGQLPSLPGILDKGRKYKTSVVLGFQALSQLKKIYGEADATSILQGLQNQFYFRMTEPSCSEYVSRMIGAEDVEQASFGVSFGSESKQDRGSLNQSRKERPLVMPEEVRALETLHAYAKICHHHPVKLRFEITERKRLQNAFVPRVRGAKSGFDVPIPRPELVSEIPQLLSQKEPETLDDFLG
jgi:hypothetical protein